MHKLMARILLIVLVTVSTVWARESSTCGHLSQTNAPHLTNANPTGIWPWHAAIYHRHMNSNSTYECGGTVISPNWILTAAHCVSQGRWSMEPNEILVSLGRLNLAAEEPRSEQSFNVTKIILHGSYEPMNLEHDIALVRLSHSATFNNFVRPVCLWKENETDFSRLNNKLGTVVGWGTTETYNVSDVLQVAQFQVVSHLDCLLSNRVFFGAYITKTNFCAGLRNGTSVCKGDSGGSMVFEEDGRYYIRGIVSSSPSKINITTNRVDCNTMEYAIYTDVAMYLQWIGNSTGDSIGDSIGAECQTKVQCEIVEIAGKLVCRFNVHPTKAMCKIIFDEIPNSAITWMIVDLDFESIPDMSDALSKFENLEVLSVNGNKLKVVERSRLSAFRRIKNLGLSSTQIAQLDANTFADLKKLHSLYLNDNEISGLHPDSFRGLDDVKLIGLGGNKIEILPLGLFRDNRKLETVDLAENQLKEIPSYAFNGLYNLKLIDLDVNQLEILPEGLFIDNRNLERISLQNNRIKKIESDFSQLSHLQNLDLLGNVCIHENLYNFNLSDLLNEIRTKCSI